MQRIEEKEEKKITRHVTTISKCLKSILITMKFEYHVKCLLYSERK